MARKLGHSLHIITGRLNDPYSTIIINNAEHIVHKTGIHWDKGHIGEKRKSTAVLHHQLRNVQALKPTTPTVRFQSEGAVSGG